MKADISKTGEDNLFFLIKNTPGNTNSPVNKDNSSLGPVIIDSQLPNSHNTTVVFSAIPGKGLQGSVNLNYRRTNITSNILNPPTSFIVKETDTIETLLATVSTALNVRSEDVEFTGGLPTFEQANVADIVIRAKNSSYLYVGSQTLQLIKANEIPQSWIDIDTQFSTLGNTGGWNYKN